MTNLSDFDDILVEPAKPVASSVTEPCCVEKSSIQLLNQTGTIPSQPPQSALPPKLVNFAGPQYLRKKEMPSHRLIAEYAARGFQANEISELVGRHKVTVADLLKQPHSQQYIADEVRRVASEDERVVTVIKDNVVRAVEALADIVGDESKKASDRIAAANALLDRRYGKAAQPISRNSGVNLDELSDADLAQMARETSSTGTNK